MSNQLADIELRMNAPLQECDVAVVSIDDRGLAGRLNRSVLESLGYDESDRPVADQLAEGHYLLESKGRKPILFLVIVGPGATEELLPLQLGRALEVYGKRFARQRYWIPLLGTGRGGLSDERSLELILSAISAFRAGPLAVGTRFLISLPETAEAQALLENIEANGGMIRTGSGAQAGSSADPGARSCFLMKMTPSSWYFPSIREGDVAYFNTHFYRDRRPEYELLLGVKAGDAVIGFAAGEMQQFWGLLEVLEPAHEDTARGEIISLAVRRIFSNPIPLSNARELLDPEVYESLLRVNVPPRLFFPLSAETFDILERRSGAVVQTYVNPFRPSYLTEGRHRDTDDQLDFRYDIESFATIISQLSVRPPLAIGLFGNWGSGKSFFMEKLEARIRDFAASGAPGTVSNVVHVRFNSWHYSDTNLWASLITEIFEQLNAFVRNRHQTDDVEGIYRELELTKLQLAVMRKEIEANAGQRKALDLEQQQVRQQQEDVQSRLKEFRAGNLFRVVLNDEHIQARIRKFNRDFDLKPIEGELGEISSRLASLGDAWGRIREAWQIMRSYRGWKPVALLATILILVPVCGVLVYRFRGELNSMLVNLSVTGTAIVAAFVTLMKWLRPGLKTVNAMYRSLKDMQNAIDTEHQRLESREAAMIRSLEAEQQRLAAEELRLREQLEAAGAREKALQSELSDIGSGRMLAGFLASKSSDEAYMRQLGIMSWIRKDFARLNSLFENQKTVRARQGEHTVEIGIDRIVLYIDDLDRCNETVVVQVLEAIHLLLAFELFVVIVGVDPRWLNNALVLKYRHLFGGRGGRGVADSYDYLEKIFQIPFALKPITNHGRQKLLSALLKAELAEDADPDTLRQSTGPAAPATVGAARSSDDMRPAQELSGQDTAASTGIQHPDRQGSGPGGARLRVSGDELRFMQQISPLFGHTPRTINRYVNIYRLLKAHGSLRVRTDFSADEYQPLMLLLGIVVGCGAAAEPFIRALDLAPESQSFADFLVAGGVSDGLCRTLQQLTAGMDSLSVADLRRNLDLVSRFSFRTLSTE